MLPNPTEEEEVKIEEHKVIEHKPNGAELNHVYFDFDTSAYSQEAEYILSLEHGLITTKRKLPEYLTHLIPDLQKNQ